MAAQRLRRQSKRFVPPANSEGSRQDRLKDRSRVFAEGDWPSIRRDLELRGWSSPQLDIIQAELRQGWPLQIAERHAAMKLGTCPIGSRSLG